MSAKQVQKQIQKPSAKKVEKSPKPAPKAGVSDAAFAALAQAIEKSAQKPAVQSKAEREAERAKRYPAEAAKAAAKKAAEAKPKAAPVEKKAAAPIKIDNRVRTKGQVTYAVAEAARPSSGRDLFCHTRAALTMLGMLTVERKPVTVGALTTMMGSRAVKYHTAERNFADAPNGSIRLSEDGYTKFLTRPVDANLTNAYLNLMLTGKVDGTPVKKEQVFQSKFD